MKRYLSPDESDESRSKSRRVLDSRSNEEEDEAEGFLDLNSTPRGFDLNAPVAEDDSSHGQSGWLPAQDEFEGKGDTTEASRSMAAETVVQRHAFTSIDDDAGPAKSEDSASCNGPSEANESCGEKEKEDAGISPKESCAEEDEISAKVRSPKLPILATLLIQRTLEPVLNLGIDDDLDIIRSVWRAHQQNDLETLDNLIVEACEELAKCPSNPSRYHYLSCLYISKKLPEAFGLPKASKALIGFFRSLAGSHPTAKRQMMLPVLGSRLLLRAFASSAEWPFEFVQIYLEDAILSRSWIEHEGCKEFVANILTAFLDVDLEFSANTEDATLGKSQDCPGGSGELVQGQSLKGDIVNSQFQGMQVALKNRYPSEEVRSEAKREFLQALNQLLSSASTKENPRQLLKLLMQGAGYEEVRALSSNMLEGYLNNPVHLRAGKALLDRILQHTRGTSEKDLQTVANLLALRITSLQPSGQAKSLHGNIFSEMVTQLMKRRPEYTTLALKHFVTAEVNNRNPHNLKSIIMVLKAMPESPPPEYELALILQELTANEDSPLQIRDLVRRVMKQIGSELDVHALCHGLMQPWPAMGEQVEALKEAWLKQLVDLACQLLLLAAVPFAQDENLVAAVIPAVNVSSGVISASQKEKLLQLEKFSLDTASFQVEAVAWCTDVLAIYLPSMGESQFTHIVRQLLFLESSEAYYPASEAASELDLTAFRLVSSCVPAPEEILARLILMAISNYPVSQGEALKLIERLVWRAASLKKHIDGALTAASVQLPAAIFKLASFSLPGVTHQPVAQLVVKDTYWRACLVVLIIAAYNPATIGWFVWENVPTIRCLMEALLTCTRTFCPIGFDELRFSEAKKIELEAKQRDCKAEEAISAFLDVLEKRQNESNSTDVDSRNNPMLSPGSRLTNQREEWKGKVMFLNQSGPVRRPPKSVVDELNRVDTKYNLGYLLRKSRSPDFFAEITKQQTLPQAWAWLQKVLVQAPEVITYLPPVWGSELLFMHEGQHPLIRKVSLDTGRLCSYLHQIIAQPIQVKEGEIESVVHFLSQKLIAKSGAVRVWARRCFSELLEPSLSNGSDLQSLLSSSPQDSKRVDGVTTTVNNQHVKGTVNAIASDSLLGFTKKAASVSATSSHGFITSSATVQSPNPTFSSASGGFLRSSPGVIQVSGPKDVAQDQIPIWPQNSAAGEDCGWLQNVEKVATPFRVVSVLVPAVEKALQQENSVPVVRAYLEFLKKHLSRTSLICCLATFIVDRPLVASSLLLGAILDTAPQQEFIDSEQINRGTTIDLILDSLSKALEFGTVNNRSLEELARVQSPVVTLVLPHVAFGTNEMNHTQVKIHKVAVDAALEVLALLSQNNTADKRINTGFQRLSDMLFPAYDHVEQAWRQDNPPIGWLEEESGKRRPLLSKLQAKTFVQSRNSRLVTIGLSVLDVESKLEIFEHFGLSRMSAAALLADLNPLQESRLAVVLQSSSYGRKRLKMLSNCVKTLLKTENNSGESLLRVLQKLAESGSMGQSKVRPMISRPEESKPYFIEPSEGGNLSGSTSRSIEEITICIFEWFTSIESLDNYPFCQRLQGKRLDYIRLRQRFQKALIAGWNEEISKNLNRIIEMSQGKSLGNSRFIIYGLPILAVLSHYVTQLTTFGSLIVAENDMQVPFSYTELLLSEITLVDLKFQDKSLFDSKASAIFLAASGLIENLRIKGANATTNAASESLKDMTITANAVDIAARWTKRESSTRSIGDWNVTSKMLEEASLYRIEPLLRGFLVQKMQLFWEQIFQGSNIGILSTDISEPLLQLLMEWTQKCCPLPDTRISIESTALSVFKDEVEYSGRCGLVMEILEILDPEFQSYGFLKSIMEISQSKSRPSSGLRILSSAFACLVHKSSWSTMSRVFHGLLEIDLNAEGIQAPRHDPVQSGAKKYYSDEPTCTHHEGWEAVMEFISLCIQHPRLKFEYCMTDESSRFNWTKSRMEASTACNLTKHAVSACVSAKMQISVHDMLLKRSNVWIQQFVQGLEETLSPESRCLKVLLIAASHGSQIMHSIVHELLSNIDKPGPELTHSLLDLPAQTATKAVAHKLLQGLYLVFPVAVEAILRSSEHKLLLQEERRQHDDINCVQGQTCSAGYLIHNALRSICNANEKDSNTAYGFCQEFACQHPSLVIPHLLTFRLYLKELLPLLKQGDPLARSTVTRALSMGLGLLDALRPLVIVISNAEQKISNNAILLRPVNLLDKQDSATIQPKSDLEAVLDLYFQVLQDIEVQVRPQFVKVVARLSDFLCHCVAAGGRICQYVAAYRTPLLETTAQNFAKLKKIGFLLSLLDKPGDTLNADEIVASGAVVNFSPKGVSYPTSSIAIEDIVKVRGQLQQCIKLHSIAPWTEQALASYNTGPLYQVSHTGENLEEGQLSATLNDLERASARMPAILNILEDSLVELTAIKDATARERIYNLLERSLLHRSSDGSASNVVLGILQQLKSSDVLLAKSASRNASRFFHFSPDLQESLLIEMLLLGRIASDDLQQLLKGLFFVAGCPVL